VLLIHSSNETQEFTLIKTLTEHCCSIKCVALIPMEQQKQDRKHMYNVTLGHVQIQLSFMKNAC